MMVLFFSLLNESNEKAGKKHIIMFLFQGFILRTHGHGKTPLGTDRNKENISHVRNPPCGTPKSQDTQDHTFNSVAASYSDFAVNAVFLLVLS